MKTERRALLMLPFAFVVCGLPRASRAQAAATPSPLAPLAHWIGGEWVGEFEAAGGRRFKLVRSYSWGFDQRLIVGRSFGEVDGRRRQSRETVFFWNPETRRIEFVDHLDQAGGHGLGSVELRDGQIVLETKIVGNPGHPSWRAFIRETGDDQDLRLETLGADGQWKPAGSFAYRRVR